MKIALAQIRSNPGDVWANTSRIIEAIKESQKRRVDLIVFPELAIPGYCHLDLLFNKSFVESNLKALESIQAETKNITAVIGFANPLKNSGHNSAIEGQRTIENSAAILQNGALLGIQGKTLLPDYDIFSERRYYRASKAQQLFEVGSKKIAIQICEDLWDRGYADKITEKQLGLGADVLINLSASPFNLGKHKERHKLVTKHSNRGAAFIFCNAVGSFDGYDGEIVFDGRSFAYGPSGNLIHEGAAFREDLFYIDHDSTETTATGPLSENEEIFGALCLGLKEYFDRHPFYPAMVGLSGGIDSALVLTLAVEALGAKNVLAFNMPSKFSSQGGITDSYLLAKNLGVRLHKISIQKLFETALQELGADPDKITLSEENLQARIRMLYLMYNANRENGSLLNTSNKTEFALGYTTIYGDMAGALAVIGDLDKQQVYSLARYINHKKNKELIPKSIIERIPSAELKENQKDEDSMGAAPEKIAELVNAFVEEDLCLEEVKARYGSQFSDQLIRRTQSIIFGSEWKRRQAPPAIRVTPKAFGLGRRIPMGFKGY
jgi:NAD+ synthase (glutamine-hydrolysing)